MSTQKQLDANRRNSLKSTGPTTPAQPKHREGAKALSAFRVYSDLGRDRSLEALKRKLDEEWPKGSPALSMLKSYSRWFNWQERVHAFDRDVALRAETEAIEEAAREREARRRERLALATVKRDMVRQALTDDQDKPIDLHGLEPAMINALNRFLQTAEDTERLDLGEATTRVEGATTPGGQPMAQINVLSNQQLISINRFLDPDGWNEMFDENEEPSHHRQRNISDNMIADVISDDS
jgi:hypothetical protein